MSSHGAISEVPVSSLPSASSGEEVLAIRRQVAFVDPPAAILAGKAERGKLLVSPPVALTEYCGPPRKSRQQYRRTIHSPTDIATLPVPTADRASRCARGDTLSIHPDLLSGRATRSVSLETSLITPVLDKHRVAKGDVVSQCADLPGGSVLRGRAPSGDEPNFGPFTGPMRKSRRQPRRTLPSGGSNNSLIAVQHAHRRFPRGDVVTQYADLPTGKAKRANNPGDQVPVSPQFIGPRRKSRQQYRRTLPIDVQGSVLPDFFTIDRRYARSHILDTSFWFTGRVVRGPLTDEYREGKRKHRDARPQQHPIPEGRVSRSLPMPADTATDPVQRRRYHGGDSTPAIFPVQVTRRLPTLEESGAVGADRPVRIKLRRPGTEMLEVAPFRRRPLIRPPEDPVFMRRRPYFFETFPPTIYDVYRSGRIRQFFTGEDGDLAPCPSRPIYTDAEDCPDAIYTESEDAPAALVEESSQLPLVVSESDTLPGRIDEEESRPPFMNECR